MALIDYPDFLTTDTMNQQVTKLVAIVGDVDSNNTVLFQNADALDEVYNATTYTWSYPSNVNTSATNITFNASSTWDVNAANLDITATANAHLTGNDIQLEATGSNGGITLDSKDNLFNVVLKTNGSTYGVLRNNGGNLTLRSGVNDVIVLDGTNGTDATFTGTITMPSASVNTTAKDVAGAINELKALIDTLQSQVNNL